VLSPEGQSESEVSTVSSHFADRLIEQIAQKKSPAVVAIDPVYSRMPAEITEHRDLNDENDLGAALDATLEFCRRVIHAVAPYVPAIQINAATFERYYWDGLEGYSGLVQEAADRGLMVIGDVKRGDVGEMAEAYARAQLGDPRFDELDDLVAPDAVTINGYFGLDGVRPFLEVARDECKGVFVVVRSANESAALLQDFEGADGLKYCEFLAKQIAEWATDEGLVGEHAFSCLGAVVSPRDRELALRLRAHLPHSLLLVSGFGPEGVPNESAAACFRSDGTGALVAASRSIIYAYENPKYLEMYTSEWEKCIEHACKDFAAEVAALAAPQ
jgi:orotidine-5'-phosphate decarboxylase